MEIYQPREDSELLQKYVKKLALGRVLDMGTGSGIQALTAAKKKEVREVLAVDIEEVAIKKLKDKIKRVIEKKETKQNKKSKSINKKPKINNLKNLKKDQKIKVKKSDLFSKIEGKFNTIIFNPPYLPQDKIGKEIIEDPSLYGGKKGWETLERFFSQVISHLFPDGQILIIFSSLTNQEKINQIIHHSLLEFEQLEKIKLPFFEELYAYVVHKSKVLRELEKKNIQKIKYLTHGKRGDIFTGVFDKSTLIKSHLAKPKPIKIALKVKRKESKAVRRIKNEISYLRVLNKYEIGPKLLFYGQDFLVQEFIQGDFILDFVKKKEKKDKNQVKKVILNLLKQCFEMDNLGINKEEMHHPLKHIIIPKNNQPVLIDFERCYQTKKPHNVTQFVEFIVRLKLLKRKQVVDLLKKYKKEPNQKNFKEIVKLVF